MHWLIHSNGGLLVRIIVGIAIFATLALFNLRRNGRSATRWREYAVLLACVAAALLYGIVNDQITVSISWEYFFYGKELERVLGPTLPPDPLLLRLGAAKIGMMATWSAGLLFGVVLLLANNPVRSLPRLRYPQLLRIGLPIIAATAAGCAVIGGILGYAGALTRLSPDFVEMAQMNMFRPKHFMCTWGVHLGGYAGGILGTLLAAAIVLRQRRALQRAHAAQP